MRRKIALGKLHSVSTVRRRHFVHGAVDANDDALKIHELDKFRMVRDRCNIIITQLGKENDCKILQVQQARALPRQTKISCLEEIPSGKNLK